MTAIIEPILQLHTNGHDRTPLVLVRTEREACLIVALLGILGSGAAFVPMDPEHPLSRQRLIAECSEATLAVVSLEIWTKESHQGAKDLEWRNLLGPFVRTVVCIDRRGAPIKTIQLGTLQDAGAADEDANEDKVHEARPPGVAGLAYVMFTSGSTGVPKGVLVRASGVGALLYSFAHHNPNLVEGGFGCCGRSKHHKDALLAVTTVAFDISVLELLLPLVTGATLVLASPTASRSASALTSMLNFGTTEQSYQASSVETSGGRPQPRITMMQATPATWRMICGVDGGWRGREDMHVICGGEAFPAATFLAPTSLPSETSHSISSSFVDRCRSVINVYGPTEATVWCTAHRLSARHAVSFAKTCGSGPTAVPIGLPIQTGGADAVVVRLCQQGTPKESHVWEEAMDDEEGELWVCGPGVAAGYFCGHHLMENRARADKLTRERFMKLQASHLRRISPRSCSNKSVDIYGLKTWYRTGDIAARSSVDGLLYFRRRIENDGQVKVAGHRVELGEIEAAIRKTCARISIAEQLNHPVSDMSPSDVAVGGTETSSPAVLRVIDAAVTALPRLDLQEQNTTAKSTTFQNPSLQVISAVVLVHIAPSQAMMPSTNDRTLRSLIRRILSRTLSSVLPQYMLPFQWVLLFNRASLPLIPNGKVDRQQILRLSCDHMEKQHRKFFGHARESMDKGIESIGGNDEAEARTHGGATSRKGDHSSIADVIWSAPDGALASMRVLLEVVKEAVRRVIDDDGDDGDDSSLKSEHFHHEGLSPEMVSVIRFPEQPSTREHEIESRIFDPREHLQDEQSRSNADDKNDLETNNGVGGIDDDDVDDDSYDDEDNKATTISSASFISSDLNLEESGVASLGVVAFCAHLGSSLLKDHYHIPTMAVYEHNTVRQLARYLRSRNVMFFFIFSSLKFVLIRYI